MADDAERLRRQSAARAARRAGRPQRISWDPPQPRPKPKPGPDPEDRLDDDSPEREVVDRARVLIEADRVRPAIEAVALPMVEVAWRAGVNKKTVQRWLNGVHPLPYTVRGAKTARQFVSYVEKAEAKAQRLRELRLELLGEQA